jgi:hypothetical protein
MTVPAEPRHVGTDLFSAPHAAACPSCGAALRADASWCSLCYHDLRPAPAPEAPADAAPASPAYGGPDPLTAPLLDLVLPPVPAPAPAVQAPALEEQVPVAPPAGDLAWPCTRCGATNGIDSRVCGVCGSAFLEAASEKVSLVVPGIGDLSVYSRGQRAAIAGAVLAAILLPIAILTFVLTPTPDKGQQGTTTTIETVAP